METKTAEITIKYTEGGVCSPVGFKAGGVSCGIKKKGLKDLALIVSDSMCDVAAVYTQNKVKGAPIYVTKKNIADGKAQAIICNSGNANTCAPNGVEIAEQTCEITAEALGFKASDIAVCSTGIIGQELYIEPFKEGMPELVESLSYVGSDKAAEAIMTTDTIPKSVAVEFTLNGKLCKMGGIAKGSGMINPNMATMLSFITTDVDISSDMLQQALSDMVKKSFNQICVDGDTSTNDTVIIMANGAAGNVRIESESEEFGIFSDALCEVMIYLAKKIARDGEGAEKLLECRVFGAPDENTAAKISKSVISSDLFKAAMFGKDANWGRVLCAVGYTDGDFNTDNIDVEMGSETGKVLVCKGSKYSEYSEEEASRILSEETVYINVNLNQGECSAVAWGCDLSYEYVRINGDYRS